MDFDIKQLQGDWSKWATEANEHKKAVKDDKINSAFEEAYVLNAAFNAGKSVEEVAEIFGAEFGQKYQNKLKSDDGNISLKSDTAKDAEKDVIANYLATSRADFVKNPDWKAYAQSLKEKILSPDKSLTNRGFYTTLCNQIDIVAEAMSKFEYNSRDDILGLYKKVKAELDLDKKDKLKDFKLDVLKQMILTAETHQKTKEKELVETKYDELRKTMSREDAVETIQKSDEFKGSYFHDYWGHDANERFSGDGSMRLHKGLIHQMEDGKVLSEAREEVYQAIEAQRRKSVDDPRSSRQIGKDAKDAMGDANDKYAKIAFRGEMSLKDRLTFERSNVKAMRKEIATDELAEHNKTVAFTEKDIKDELKNDLIFNGLLAGGLISERDSLNKNNEKTYDITALSDKIRDRLGANLRADRQTGDLYPYSEVENIVKDVLVKSGVQNVSSKDAKKLIKLCGFEVEGKNWVRIVAKSVADTVIPGVSALTAVGLGMEKQVYDKTHPVEVNVNNKVHAELDLNITGGEASINKYDLMKSLKDSGFSSDDIKLIETENGFKLIIDKTEPKTHEGEPVPFYEEFSKRAGETALKTMLVSFALNFVQEAFADNQGELPIATTQFQHKSIEDYKAQIDADKKMTPAQKESIKQLAEAYIQRDKNGQVVLKDGEPVWNVEEFKLCLDRIAGSESMLNKHEFAIGVKNELKRVNDELAQVIVNIANNDLREETEEITTVKNDPEPDRILTVPHTWKANESWQAVIATYYPEAFEDFKNNLKPLVDAFRDAQGISRKSGIPRGQTLHLDTITVNGKTYSPKPDEEGARLKEFTSNKWFGWGSRYFSGNWRFPTKGVSQATSKERRISGETSYTSTRRSDKAVNTGRNERSTQDALKPSPQDGVVKNVTVRNSDGTQYDYKIKPKE